MFHLFLSLFRVRFSLIFWKTSRQSRLNNRLSVNVTFFNHIYVHSIQNSLQYVVHIPAFIKQYLYIEVWHRFATAERASSETHTHIHMYNWEIQHRTFAEFTRGQCHTLQELVSTIAVSIREPVVLFLFYVAVCLARPSSPCSDATATSQPNDEVTEIVFIKVPGEL